jgi:hypothetical protein
MTSWSFFIESSALALSLVIDDLRRAFLCRGPRAFGRSIRDAKFPSHFQAPTNVPRYDGDTNPSVWLKDYRLACHAGGATDDLFVIKNLPLYLGDSALMWLEHLPRDKIQDWTDLWRVFVGNFQGTYTRPGKQWELRNCKQQLGESLHEYIRRFSKCYTELPGATDNDVISAFQNGTTCTSLIHQLGRRMPRMTRELLDIASNHADGEEAVAATLNTPQGKGKQVVDQGEGTSSRFKKKKKNGNRHRDDNFVAAVEHKTSHPKGNSGKPAPTKDHFEKLLDAPCPHHEVPVKHTLRECRLMKNYVKSTLKPKTADHPDKQGPSHDNDDGAGAMFPGEDEAVHMIFGGSPARPSRRREKLIRREVTNADVAKPSYLKWSEVPITFDRKDHPDTEPQPRSYPLAVAPLFRTRRIHKVLMDGGSGINVLYASTLDDMGIPRSAQRLSMAPFHRVVPGIEALPLGQIDLPVMFGDVRNFRTKTLTFEVVGFSGTYHAILGRPAYAKFMAVPNYTYLKLKILGPMGIITVRPMYQRAYECDAECFQFAEAAARSARLHARPRSEDQDILESSKRAACSFEPARQGRQGHGHLRRRPQALYRDSARS